MLVNRLWCQVSVRILWENVWNYDTLISCFPNESKEILHKNGIITPTLTSKPPLFNYVVFIRSLEVDNIIKNIRNNYNIIGYIQIIIQYTKNTDFTSEYN